MGQITRHHHGPVKIDMALIREIEWVLDMEPGHRPSRADVVAAREELHREAAEHGYWPWTYDSTGIVHDMWEVLEVDAVQRLRGWHRARYGTVTTDAAALSQVRNFLDGLLLSGYGQDCEQLLSEIEDDECCAEEAAIVKAAIDGGKDCLRCEDCRILTLRDRCDETLDANGYDGGVYYRSYVLGQSIEEANRPRAAAVAR